MIVNWWEGITKEDLPNGLKALADKIGISPTLEVWNHFEGSEFYFPSIKGNWCKRLRYEAIATRVDDLSKEVNGPSVFVKVGREFGLTARRVREIYKTQK